MVVKAWASGQLHALCRPVLIGSAAALQGAIDQQGLKTKLRVIDAPERRLSRRTIPSRCLSNNGTRRRWCPWTKDFFYFDDTCTRYADAAPSLTEQMRTQQT